MNNKVAEQKNQNTDSPLDKAYREIEEWKESRLEEFSEEEKNYIRTESDRISEELRKSIEEGFQKSLSKNMATS